MGTWEGAGVCGLEGGPWGEPAVEGWAMGVLMYMAPEAPGGGRGFGASQAPLGPGVAGTPV